jgi:hypothetical protein
MEQEREIHPVALVQLVEERVMRNPGRLDSRELEVRDARRSQVETVKSYGLRSDSGWIGITAGRPTVHRIVRVLFILSFPFLGCNKDEKPEGTKKRAEKGESSIAIPHEVSNHLRHILDFPWGTSVETIDSVIKLDYAGTTPAFKNDKHFEDWADYFVPPVDYLGAHIATCRATFYKNKFSAISMLAPLQWGQHADNADILLAGLKKLLGQPTTDVMGVLYGWEQENTAVVFDIDLSKGRQNIRHVSVKFCSNNMLHEADAEIHPKP